MGQTGDALRLVDVAEGDVIPPRRQVIRRRDDVVLFAEVERPREKSAPVTLMCATSTVRSAVLVRGSSRQSPEPIGDTFRDRAVQLFAGVVPFSPGEDPALVGERKEDELQVEAARSRSRPKNTVSRRYIFRAQ